MSNLISGKEAFNAVLDGNSVLWRHVNHGDWLEWTKNTAWCVEALEHDAYQFRLKPRTITLNGIEVPTPFEPKEGDHVWCMSDYQDGWVGRKYRGQYSALGYWRTEEEIKQVVEALRKAFKGGVE